ncbi:hypothetical protein SPRG_07882 [Saprolegnia parasitica CBS 223.65]|uniref:Uncharacterized protein n=1 Tax=Saprolegnia parasitica (strain CBS 223.65) TaxID=695850 RepID=A0A067CBW5_SAPPC|nr:hypothetical protein SPRG_07882 [Saprolegnia parasitica CBS 223.65]KDO26660.1 hypothetical protein SPRG_07882 [Saprolegnia parasitica CBS 223.65]|eukprot:XP_012202544.1 hypothetical protein SPRG_07882 [Saprolegnia parasitica CBS 223.65]
MTQESFLVLQKENHALLRENNALHLELIRCQEELEAKAMAMTTLEKDMDHRVQELTFLNAQKSQQLQKKDTELQKLYAQLQRFEAKPGDDTSIELKRQLPDAKRTQAPAPPVPSASADDAWYARRQRGHLKPPCLSLYRQRQFQSLSVDNKALHHQVQQLETHIASREAEIDRLGKLLKDGHQSKNFAEIKAMYDMEAYHLEQQLEHEQLLHQVDILNEQVAKYERKLQASKDDVDHAKYSTQQLALVQDQNRRYLHELETTTRALQALEAEHASCTTSYDEQAQALAKLELALSNANDQVATQKARIAALETTMTSSSYDKVASSHAVSDAQAQASASASELAQLRPKFAALQTKVSELELARKELALQKEAHERELEILRANLGLQASDKTRSLETTAELSAKVASLEAAVDERDAQLRRRCVALEDAESRVAELQSRLESLLQTQRALQARVDDETRERQVRTTSDRQDEIDALRKEKVQLDVQLASSREALLANDARVREAEAQVDLVHQQLLRSQAETAELTNQLKRLKADAVEYQETAMRLELQCNEAGRQLEWYKQVQQDQVKGKQDSVIFQQRCQAALLEKTQAETQVATLTASQSMLRKQLEKAQDDLRSAHDQLAQLRLELDEQARAVASAGADASAAQQGKLYFKTEFERVSDELSECATTLQQEERSHHATRQLHAQVARQVQDLTAQLHRAQAKSSQLEQQLEQAKATRSSLERQWTLAKEDGQTHAARCASLEVQIKRLSEETAQLSERALVLEQDKTQLRHLLLEMEHSRDALQLQSKQAQLDASFQGQKTTQVHALVDDLRAQVAAANAEIAHLKDVVQTLDAENDSLHNSVDLKTESADALTQQLHASQEEYTRLRLHVQDCEQQLSKLEHALNAKEDEVSFLQKQLDATSTALSKATDDVSLRTAEHVALQQDLQHMTVENQSLSNECTKLHFELDQVEEDHRALHAHVRTVERERDALQIELDDIKQSYRAAVLEMDALDTTRQQLSHRREETSAINDTLRKQMQSVLLEKEAATQHVAELRAERTILMDQIKQLSLQLERSAEQAEEASRSQAMLQGALSSQHNVASELASERFETVAQTSTLQQKLSHLQARLNHALHDKTELSQQSLRVQMATTQGQLADAREEREAMAAQLQAYQQQPSPVSPLYAASSVARGTPPSLPRSTPSSGSRASSNFMAEAEARCKALEDRLAKQDATIQQLEHSRTKFRKFAAKYEKELDERDRVIDELRSSMRSSHRYYSDEEETKTP